MRSKILFVSALLFGAALILDSAGCNDMTCTRSTDCPTNLVCNSIGACVPKATHDADGGDDETGTDLGDAGGSDAAATTLPDLAPAADDAAPN